MLDPLLRFFKRKLKHETILYKVNTFFFIEQVCLNILCTLFSATLLESVPIIFY